MRPTIRRRRVLLVAALLAPLVLFAVAAERASWRVRGLSLNFDAKGADYVALAAKSPRVIHCAGTVGRCDEWDTEQGALLGTHSVAVPPPATGQDVQSIAVAPDARQFALAPLYTSNSGGRHGGVALVDTATGSMRRLNPEHEAYALLRYSPDGTRLVAIDEGQYDIRGFSPVAYNDDERMVDVWDTATGRRLAHYDAQLHTNDGLAFSPDGRTLVLGGGGGPETPLPHRIVFRATASGKIERRLYLQEQPDYLAYHPDGRELVVGVNAYPTLPMAAPALQWWDIASGKMRRSMPLKTFAAAEHMAQLVVSPDGHVVACRVDTKGSGPSTGVALFDYASGRLLRRLPLTLQRRAGSPASGDMVFSADSSRLKVLEPGGAVSDWRVR